MKAVSLFASGGIGDLALAENGYEVIVANELLSDRASLFSHNFPQTEMITGDIWEVKDNLVDRTRSLLKGSELELLLATPPCQGMSKNGQGTILNNIRKGMRPQIDPRNRLIIPTVDIIKQLQPRTIVFENVPEMMNTLIDDEDGNYVNIVDYIRQQLGEEYIGKAEVVEFADYGVPQRRKRLITVFTKDPELRAYFLERGSFLPIPTHDKDGKKNRKKWVTVRDIIAELPPLDAENADTAKSDIPFHYVSVLDPKKYTWVSNTPPEDGAFHNQCINPECYYDKNPTHGSTRDENGVNKASVDTPLYCIKCGELLPRPYVEKDGVKRLMNGFTSAYKRMAWDLPCSTLTTNLSYPSSDHKLHPEQHRVLSLYEAFKLHTISDFPFEWNLADGRRVNDGLIRDVIGESIPPRGLSHIIRAITLLETDAEARQLVMM